MMFERFTTDARRIVVDAQAHARRLGHHYIGSEHLLLAVVSSETEVAAVMRDIGLTADAVESVIVRLVGAPGHILDGAALASIGIDLDGVRERAEAAFGPHALSQPSSPSPTRRGLRRWGSRKVPCGYWSGHIPFTPAAKKCLELSLREALALKHRHIGAEHLVLGIVRANDGRAHHGRAPNGRAQKGLAGDVLQALHVSPEHVRHEVLRRQRLAG